MMRRSAGARLSTCAIGLWAALCGSAIAEPASAIADGTAWSMTAQNGRTGKLTLNPDGSGTMRAGPFSIATIWWSDPSGDVCLENQRMGTRCLTFVARADGFDGMADGAVMMQLRR